MEGFGQHVAANARQLIRLHATAYPQYEQSQIPMLDNRQCRETLNPQFRRIAAGQKLPIASHRDLLMTV